MSSAATYNTGPHTHSSPRQPCGLAQGRGGALFELSQALNRYQHPGNDQTRSRHTHDRGTVAETARPCAKPHKSMVSSIADREAMTKRPQDLVLARPPTLPGKALLARECPDRVPVWAAHAPAMTLGSSPTHIGDPRTGDRCIGVTPTHELGVHIVVTLPSQGAAPALTTGGGSFS
jgi:hypothetical protein